MLHFFQLMERMWKKYVNCENQHISSPSPSISIISDKSFLIPFWWVWLIIQCTDSHVIYNFIDIIAWSMVVVLDDCYQLSWYIPELNSSAKIQQHRDLLDVFFCSFSFSLRFYIFFFIPQSDRHPQRWWFSFNLFLIRER